MADAASMPNTYESLYQRAMQLAGAGDLDGAVATFRRILGRLSSLSDATLRQRGDLASFAYMVTGQLVGGLAAAERYDEAADEMQRALRFSPEDADAVEREVAIIRARQGRLEDARDALLSLTERFSEDAEHWVALAQVQAALGDRAAADAAIESALAVAPDDMERATIQYQRFLIRAHQGDVDGAVAAWDATADLAPEVDLARRELYALLLKAGETTRLRRYVDSDQAPARAEFYRGMISLREGDYTGARRQWEKVIALNPLEQSVGHVEWLEAALRLGDIQKAAAILNSESPDMRTPYGMLLAAVTLSRLSRTGQAMNALSGGVARLGSRFPWKRQYGFEDWDLFTTFVDNRAAWANLRQFFDTTGVAATPAAEPAAAVPEDAAGDEASPAPSA